ncbi:MAG: 3'-5' exoribonuclease YhaM family protein [Planctomycetota bacterium]
MSDQRRYISDLTPNEPLDQVFLVRDKELRTARNGKQYVQATLADRTGTISARLWDANEGIFQGIPTDGFLRVKGRTDEYKGVLQVIIEGCRPWAAEKVDIADFLATTDQDVEAMWTELLDILQDIKDEPLRRLLKKFTEDQKIVAAYKRAPAAMQMHHPFMGGLLEHTLGMARSTRAILPLYPKLNADLLLAAVFLHDIGKTAELTSGLSITYTDRGQLVGHITIAAIWVQEKAALVAEETGEPIPAKTISLLQHLILSHHGFHDYGSPKLPAVPEAIVLHYLDNLDAKMFMMFNAIDSDSDPEATFTPYLRQLETRVFKGGQTL